MNAKLEIKGEKYTIEIVDYGVDDYGWPDYGYMLFGFNPDGSAVLLGDSVDDTWMCYSGALQAGFGHLLNIIDIDKSESNENT